MPNPTDTDAPPLVPLVREIGGDEWMAVTTAARRLGVSRYKVTAAVLRGDLLAVTFGGVRFVERAGVERLRRRAAPAAPRGAP